MMKQVSKVLGAMFIGIICTIAVTALGVKGTQMLRNWSEDTL